MSNKTGAKTPVWLISLLIAYGTLLLALTALNRFGADRWWFGALNLYLPQAVWAIPALVLTVVTWKMARRLLWAPLLCILLVAVPLMDLCLPLSAPSEPPGYLPVRVLTWNIKYGLHGKGAIQEIINEIERNHPAILFFQDAGDAMSGPLGAYFKTWNVRFDGQYLVASKLPLEDLKILALPFFGEEQSCLRTRVRIGETTVTLFDVHLQTPRHGLEALRETKSNPWDLPQAILNFENNVAARLTQVRELQSYISHEQGPVIVAGDLNSPDASQVCAALRGLALHDAFAEGGTGYGYTYGHFLLQHKLPGVHISWMRLDHIMMSSQFLTRNCQVGSALASDHRPVIADLMLVHN